MPYADPQRAKTERRRYYVANRPYLIERQTARRIANPEYMKQYNADHREHIAAHNAGRLAARRAYVAEMKAKPCADCGDRFPPECMDFDHVRGEKVGDISKMLLRSTDLLHDEMAKCDVVCANCHRIRTHITRTLGRAIK